MTPPREISRTQAGHRATGRVLDVFELLLQHRDGLTLTDLSLKLQVPKSSLLELLRTLRRRDYLELTPDGRYRLGPKAREMALGSLAQRELPELARPFLVDLMEKSGETVFLGVLASSGLEVVYIDKVESPQAIRYTAGLGERRPLYCTAIGKAILAFLPPEQQDEYLRSVSLSRFTERTVTDRRTLREGLRQIRGRRVATNFEEKVLGAAAVAAPIFDWQGRVVAACTLAGPTARIAARQGAFSRMVRDTAGAVSRALGLGGKA